LNSTEQSKHDNSEVILILSKFGFLAKTNTKTIS